MKNNSIRLATCGALIAVSFGLSFVKIGLPFGGSVTAFSMVPLIFAAILYGFKWGMMSSGIYALLQLLQGIISSKSFVLDKASDTALMIILDFVVAFAFIGIAGIFVKRDEKGILIPKQKKLLLKGGLGALLVTIIRYGAHTASGFILYGTYAEWFFGEEFVNPIGNWALSNLSGTGLALFYSAVYNGLYMIPEIILTVLGTVILLRVLPLEKIAK